MRVVSLASGSRGNAYLVGNGNDWLLVDEGLSYRMFRTRLQGVAGWSDSSVIHGVLVTHSHTDHTGGFVQLARHAGVTFFANANTADSVAAGLGMDGSAFCCFENGQEFEVGPFSVHPFSIPHDTSDPVGYLVRIGGETYFHGTDIGTPADSIGLKFAEADAATLESNHDSVLLHTSGRPAPLIQRISGPRGHLSNDQACELVGRFASPRLKRLALAHLSHDCNDAHLAEGAMRRQLRTMNRSDVDLKVFLQDEVVEL